MNTTYKATLALSLTASILFSSTSIALAMGKSEQAHQQSAGWVKNFGSSNIESTAQNSTQSNSLTTDHQATPNSHSNTVAEAKVLSNRTVAQPTISKSNQLLIAQAKPSQVKSQQVQGYQGTVKVGEVVLGNGPDGNKGNKPHLPCSFQIEAYGFGSSVSSLQYEIISQAPSTPKDTLVASGTVTVNPTNNFNGKTVVNLADKLDGLKVHDKQGVHVWVKVTYDNQVSNGFKSKVFWVKCATTTNPDDTDTQTPGTTTGNDDKGQTLSTNTKNTAVLGSNIERSNGGVLPFTGGAGAAAAQAFGLSLIVFGVIMAHVRKIQVKIQEQMSI